MGVDFLIDSNFPFVSGDELYLPFIYFEGESIGNPTFALNGVFLAVELFLYGVSPFSLSSIKMALFPVPENSIVCFLSNSPF